MLLFRHFPGFWTVLSGETTQSRAPLRVFLGPVSPSDARGQVQRLASCTRGQAMVAPLKSYDRARAKAHATRGAARGARGSLRAESLGDGGFAGVFVVVCFCVVFFLGGGLKGKPGVFFFFFWGGGVFFRFFWGHGLVDHVFLVAPSHPVP